MGGSDVTIKIWKRERRNSVQKEGRVPLHQKNTKALEEVSDGIILLLASAPSLGSGQLPNLVHSLVVPPT